MTFLTIRNLGVAIEDRAILSSVHLDVDLAEIHAVMGPNGSGKSSLAMTLMGNSHYVVSTGSVTFDGQDLLSMSVDERARAGLYLAWQSPLAIPGLNIFTLCKAAYEASGRKIESVVEFKKRIEDLLIHVGLTKEHLSRGVNEGFSGGEKKRLELLQLLLLEPKLAILDEIDSGLDVDALKLVGEVVSQMKEKGTSFLLITHYKRLLDYVQPTHVHILKQGRIVESGGQELVERIERGGYGNV